MPTRNKGGRPATGSIKWERNAETGVDQWFARISAKGKRARVALDPAIPREDEDRARACARMLAAQARDQDLRPHVNGETVEEYAKRWLEKRRAKGNGSVDHDAGRLRKHVFRLIGHLDVRRVTRDDIERVVEDLDRKIALDEADDEHLAWKTASNVWVLVSKMFKDAVDAKRRDLRVRAENPAEKVKPPERGDSKAKQYLYPSEFTALVSCGAIDIAFRTLYAAAVYVYARAGELEALTWDDVDLEHGVIHITKAVDRRTGKVKSTKSGETRRIPIEPNLRPLLARLVAERTDEHGRCLWLPDDEDRAVMLRQHLAMAKVTRHELFVNDAARRHITFHDLRATAITWMAVRGDDPLRIKQRAGHKAFSTTEIYIREAENLAHGFGAPFPALPLDLTRRPDGVLDQVSGFGFVPPENPDKNHSEEWSKGGSNP